MLIIYFIIMQPIQRAVQQELIFEDNRTALMLCAIAPPNPQISQVYITGGAEISSLFEENGHYKQLQ